MTKYQEVGVEAQWRGEIGVWGEDPHHGQRIQFQYVIQLSNELDTSSNAYR